jgi:predicted deacylase
MSKQTIRVGTIEAAPGTKNFEYLPVRLPTEIRTSIPVGIVNGSNPGPVLCLTAGHHGLEYAGIEAVMRTFKQANPKELNGGLITVPTVNLLGFQKKTPYLCPIDGVNIARIYPGDPNGSLSYVIAHTVLNEIVTKADYAMDCHGADVFESLNPYTLFYNRVGDKEVVTKMEGMAKAYGLNYYSADSCAMKLMEEAPKRGVPLLLAEIGGQEWEGGGVDMHLTGIGNVMNHLGIIKGKPRINQPPQNIASKKEFGVVTRNGGIWYPRVQVGEKVKSGQVLGEMKDLDGEVKETIYCPCDGTVHFQWTFHVLDPGFPIMRITSA